MFYNSFKQDYNSCITVYNSCVALLTVYNFITVYINCISVKPNLRLLLSSL